MSDKPFIPHSFKVHVVGKAATDAKMDSANTSKGTRPVCKFSVWVGYGRESREKDAKYLPTDIFSVKAWGDDGKNIKKGDDVEFFGLKKKHAYNGKIYEYYEVQTNEQGAAMLNYPGIPQKSKHVSDEQVASGSGKTIQRKESVEITDEDIPF